MGPPAGLATPGGMQKFANQHKRVCDATAVRRGERERARQGIWLCGVGASSLESSKSGIFYRAACFFPCLASYLTFMHVPLSVAVVTGSLPSASSREGEREQGKANECVCGE